MNDIERVSENLGRAALDLLMSLQTTKALNANAFAQLDAHARELAILLKGSHQIPRKVVNELYMTAKALENEAPHAKDKALVAQWSAAIYGSFDLIMLGETHADYQPGVARVR